MQIRIVTDQNNLVETTNFPAKFSFTHFNPIQSRAIEYYNKDVNFLSASNTGSGKTALSELFSYHEIRINKKKVLYVSPLKTLANQKYDDWHDENHHFKNLNVSICTGDYRLTDSRRKELEQADIIIMSYEMLAHRLRLFHSEKSDFIKNVGTLIIDEIHSVGDAERGHHLECGIMKFTQLNPDCRLIGLSGTMPNSEELAQWISNLISKETILLKSKYRPVPLNLHFEKYYNKGKYDEIEEEKVSLAIEIVLENPDDKFLIFVHTKRTGKLLKSALEASGVESDFHNADLDKTKRLKLENKFLKDPKFRVVIATSTLSAGINMPARRVIILGVHRGLSEVSSNEIMQEAGRSGRLGMDKVGDAYILIPSSEYDNQKKRILTPENVVSKMLKETGGCYKNLAFHVVSEIAQGEIKNKEDVYSWYKRTLGCFQANELDNEVIEKTLDILKKCGIIWEENNELTVTSVGKIASLFYYSPFDVADFKRNFTELFTGEFDDYKLSFALGNLDSQRENITNKVEKQQMAFYESKLHRIYDKELKEGAIKAGFAYHSLINGNNCDVLGGFMGQLKTDFARTNQVLMALNSYSKWDQNEFLKKLHMRVLYGVKDHLVLLCSLTEIGKVRSQKLYNAGIKTPKDIIENPEKAKKIIGLKKEFFDKILNEAVLQNLVE